MLEINEQLKIPETCLRFRFVRSRGPGGQNVNKLNSCAQLTFDLTACPQLAPDVKKRLARLAGRRLTGRGTLLIESDRFREQFRNRQDARNRLRRLILDALQPPKPRRPTRPTAASVRRRLDRKHRRARLKSLRQAVRPDQ